jgi:hypothetical protein
MTMVLACALAAAAVLALLPGGSPHTVGDRLGSAFARSASPAFQMRGRLLLPACCVWPPVGRT